MALTLTSLRRSPRAFVAGVVALSSLLLGSNPALASEKSPSVSEDVIENSLATIGQHEPSAIADPLTGLESFGEVTVGAGIVDLPAALSDGLVFTDAQGDRMRVDLPRAEDAESGRFLPDGTAVFPADESANSVIVTEHGVQMLTTIVDDSGPSRFSYELALAPGDRIELVGGGAVVIDASGVTTLATGVPWAMDARGQSIPTRYEVDGDALVQVVDHREVEAIAYPVVADPIWLAPWMVRCLVGIGISGPDITRIASMGSPGAILAAFGRGAVACIFGR